MPRILLWRWMSNQDLRMERKLKKGNVKVHQWSDINPVEVKRNSFHIKLKEG